jgi:hypothetical protein
VVLRGTLRRTLGRQTRYEEEIGLLVAK